MASTATILFARADLSIPGARKRTAPNPDRCTSVRSRFFKLVNASRPDVIVLDFSGAPRSGIDAILSIRRRCAVPILVVCNPTHPLTEEYRIAGAADCIPSPVDIRSLNEAIQRVLRVICDGRNRVAEQPIETEIQRGYGPPDGMTALPPDPA